MRRYDMELTARIHSTETCGTVDGPGLRYVVFFQGCRMRCRYCHNPDTWNASGGTEVTVGKLLQDALRYKTYMDFSGGGFTATGGDPLLQAGFLTELFKGLKGHGIHTAIDTGGYADVPDLDALMSYTDLVLLDIKCLDSGRHVSLTGVKPDKTHEFTEYLNKKRIPVWIRHVVIPGITDSEEDIAALAEYLKWFSNIERIDLLPFHKIGEHKWDALGLPYTLKDTPAPDKETMDRLRGIISELSGLY